MTKYRRKKYENFSLFDFILAALSVLGIVILGVWAILAFATLLVSGLVNAVISLIGFL